MKEIYEKPEIELISFQPTDRITLDGGDLDDNPGGFGSIEEW